MKKEFKGKLNLNKEKISRIESAKIKGGTGTLQEVVLYLLAMFVATRTSPETAHQPASVSNLKNFRLT
ncbi:MAG: hypothetical protein RQ735_07475 [Flavobacteriaceae bacterium]|nr:hypothetical protein [Flavobacteriaceae bacterium]